MHRNISEVRDLHYMPEDQNIYRTSTILERQGWLEMSGGAPTPTPLRGPEFSKGFLSLTRLGLLCPRK